MSTRAQRMRAALTAAAAGLLLCAAPASAAVSTGDSPAGDTGLPGRPTGNPTVSGTQQVGATLTGSDNFSGASTTERGWLRCTNPAGTSCSVIAGETGTTYTLTNADVDTVIKFRALGENVLGSREADAVTGVIDAISPSGGVPSFTGTETDGETLTGSPGTWSGTPTIGTFAYQWRRCTTTDPGTCSNIAGATGSTYLLQDADATRFIRLQVTASRNGHPGDNGTASSAPSGAIAAIPPSNTAAPTISGVARQGQVLSALPGGWSGTTPLTFTYSWQRCSGGCVGISAASSYAPTAADVGKQLKVIVTATGPGGQQDTAESALTGVIAAAPAGGGGSPTTPGTGTSPNGTTTLKRLSPFPVVAIGGRVIGSRVLVTLLRVSRAPRGSVVTVTCRGRGCPFRRARKKVRRKSGLRIRGLERRLRSGTVVTIIVRKGKTIGKYTRIRIRRGAPPARIDRCIRPGAKRPTACP